MDIKPIVDGFVKELGATFRSCLDCGCLVGGGITRCGRCAKDKENEIPSSILSTCCHCGVERGIKHESYVCSKCGEYCSIYDSDYVTKEQVIKREKNDGDRDIVDRLRDSQPIGTTGGYLLNDAADEIVRLRKLLSKDERGCVHPWGGICKDDQGFIICTKCHETLARWQVVEGLSSQKKIQCDKFDSECDPSKEAWGSCAGCAKLKRATDPVGKGQWEYCEVFEKLDSGVAFWCFNRGTQSRERPWDISLAAGMIGYGGIEFKGLEGEWYYTGRFVKDLPADPLRVRFWVKQEAQDNGR